MTAIFAAAALLGGCASKERLRLADLLREQNLVGGGMTIEWKAPEAGTVYLVEKKTRKLVETRSLDEGEAFSFTVDSVVRAQELGDILGINVAKAEFLLYFEPASRGKLGEQVGLTKP
jgi:hypothetical protein